MKNEDIVAYLGTIIFRSKGYNIYEIGDLRYGEYIYCKHYPSS